MAKTRELPDSDSVSPAAGFLDGDVWDRIGGAAQVGISLGQSVGPYRLEEILGAGGFGVVYRATDESANNPQLRTVAVKILKTLLTPRVEIRFRREVEAMQSLSHPGIASFLNSGTIEPGVGWLAMGLIDGQPIHEYCESEKPGWRRIVEMMVQVCEALEHAHERGVLHRDMKPGNILVQPTGNPVVTDFGLVRFLDPDGESTRSLTAIGTPAYMAPESLPTSPTNPMAVGPQVDVFGLGATLHRLVSGQPPGDSGRPGTSASKNTSSDADHESRPVVIACPAPLTTVVQKAIATEPESRYSSVADLRRDLENVLAGRPTEARRPSVGRRLIMFARRRPGFLLTAVIVTAIIASAGWIAIDSAASVRGTRRLAAAVVSELDEHFATIAADPDFAGSVKDSYRARLRRQQDQIIAAANDQVVNYHGAVGRFILGEYLQEIGKPSEAREQYLIAEAGFQRLHNAGYEPDETQFDLFHCSFRLYGVAVRMEDEKEMNNRLERATGLITPLAEAGPDDPVLLDCVAQMGLFQGDARLRAGKNAEAVVVLGEALEASQRAERLSGSKGKYLAKIAACTQYMGRAAAEAGNHTESEQLYAKALRLAMPDGRDKSDFERLKVEFRFRGSRCLGRIAAGRLDLAEEDIAAMKELGEIGATLNPGSSFRAQVEESVANCRARIEEARRSAK